MSRDSSQKVNSELFSLEPTALLEFFVIYYDYINLPDEKLYIHGGTNGIEGSIYWQGEEYIPFPIQSSGFETRGDGALPRPKLTVSNQDFFVSNLIRRYNNLVGAKVVRKRTFVKFLDSKNFSDSKNPYGSSDANAGLEDQTFFILRRASENRAIVEFELASPLELENVNFPKRTVMARYCSFHYRGNGCRYSGPPVADENNRIIRSNTDMRAGLLRRKYATTSTQSIPNNSTTFTSAIDALSCMSETVVTSVSPEPVTEYYFFEYLGYFKVASNQAGKYSFGSLADDCAEIFIDGKLVAGDYSAAAQVDTSQPRQNCFTVDNLASGYHRILIRYYNHSGSGYIKLFYKVPASDSWAEIPTSRYFYDSAEAGTLTATQSFSSDMSLMKYVAVNQNSLESASYMGKWKSGEDYKIGHSVYIENRNIRVSKMDINDSPNWEPLNKFYICIKNHTSSASKNPSFNKENWTADQCSKSINGCKLRFGSEGTLPFGGFPGTEEYSISQ